MTQTRQMLLGAFFVIVLAFLGAYTLFLTDFSLFKQRHELVVHFPDANGLRKGDSVQIAGIREGRIKLLTFDGDAPLDRRITATLALDADLPLREGYEIYIEDATVLGGKHVYIDPGPADGALVPTDQPLPGHVKPGPLASLGKMVDENRPRLESILGKAETMVSDLEAGKGTLGMLMRDDAVSEELKATVASAKASFANIDALTTEIREGKGPLGRLIRDEDLATKFEEVITNLQQISTDFKDFTTDVQAGKGVIGRLAKDEKLADDVQQAVATFKDITGRVNSGKGALWTLLEDEELARQIKALGEDFDKSTLGKLLTNDDMYVKLSQVADDLSISAAALRNAEGTFGKLLMDKQLYEDIRRALDILTRTLQEYREAAPISTFASIFFAGF